MSDRPKVSWQIIGDTLLPSWIFQTAETAIKVIQWSAFTAVVSYAAKRNESDTPDLLSTVMFFLSNDSCNREDYASDPRPGQS